MTRCHPKCHSRLTSACKDHEKPDELCKKELGWEAVSVNTGQDAIRVVEAGLIFRILLTDLRLPDLDGRAVAWAISRLRPHTRLAFMANARPGAPLEPRHAPFLLKPFSTAALRDALSGAIVWRPDSPLT